MEKHMRRRYWYLWILVIAALLGILGLFLMRTNHGEELQHGALIFKELTGEKLCGLLQRKCGQ